MVAVDKRDKTQPLEELVHMLQPDGDAATVASECPHLSVAELRDVLNTVLQTERLAALNRSIERSL